jgi:predicted small lipoprotein YifL
MVRPALGILDVNSVLNRTSGRWAVVLLSAVALTLAGCGRKGGLDLPPTANSPTASAVAPASTDTETAVAAKPSVFNPSYGADAAPTAPKGKKRPFVLDPLLE